MSGQPAHWGQRNRRMYGEAHGALPRFLPQRVAVGLGGPASAHAPGCSIPREADAFCSLLLERKHDAVPGQIAHLDGHSTPGVACGAIRAPRT